MAAVTAFLGASCRHLRRLQGNFSSDVIIVGFCYAHMNDLGVVGGRQVCQGRVRFVKSVDKQEAMWEAQHELAAEKVYSLCSELGGFFLKVLVPFVSSNVTVVVVIDSWSKGLDKPATFCLCQFVFSCP